MRVTITTSGSRGDVQPYVALGRGLAESGHQVTVTAPSDFRELVSSQGLDFLGVDANPRETTERMLREGAGLISFARSAPKALRPILVEMLQSYLEACAGSDIVLYTPVGFFGQTISKQLQIPCIGLAVQPIFQVTDQFPSPFVRPLQDDFSSMDKPPGVKTYNSLSHLLTQQLLWQGLRGGVNNACEKVLDSRPYSVRGPFRKMSEEHEPALLGWSPSVLPKPHDWGSERMVTGYWFLPSAHSYNPPTDLEDFIAGGSKPISIGFGSMQDSEDPHFERMTQTILDAVKLSGQRAILLTGWAGAQSQDLPDNVFAIEEAPHDWLFDKVSVAVHHGSAGTTAASLRAGIPTITIPFFADQPFWGARVAQLGVGPKPIPRQKLTSEVLSHTIMQAVSDSKMRQKAADIGKIIRYEDGVGKAVEYFNEQVNIFSAGMSQ